MEQALWLFVYVPVVYVVTVVNYFPTTFGVFPPALAAIGIICLLTGIVQGYLARQKYLLTFLLLPAASQLYLVFVGFTDGKFEPGALYWILPAYLATQVLAAGYLIYRFREARLSAVFLAIFCLSYAVFAAFFSSMVIVEGFFLPHD